MWFVRKIYQRKAPIGMVGGVCCQNVVALNVVELKLYGTENSNSQCAQTVVPLLACSSSINAYLSCIPQRGRVVPTQSIVSG